MSTNNKLMNGTPLVPLLMKAMLCWFNRAICDFIHINDHMVLPYYSQYVSPMALLSYQAYQQCNGVVQLSYHIMTLSSLFVGVIVRYIYFTTSFPILILQFGIAS
jgi:hypothetical protein